MITGSLVRLRRLMVSDAEFMHRWNNDPEYAGKYEPHEPVTLEWLRGWISGGGDSPWYIMENIHGECLGQMVATRKGGAVEVGYRVVPPMRGRGYCTEAVGILVGHLFKDDSVQEVWAETNPGNIASRRVLERNGFKVHEYKRDAVRINGVLMDGVVYRLTRDDYVHSQQVL